jgi:putative sigma-54 modulation protein
LTYDKVRIHAKEESESMYSSIDALMDKVRMQIKKNKEKIKRHMSGKKQSIKDESSDEIPLELEIKNVPDHQIILETIDYKPMDIEDAVVELNSGKQPFFVFNNARTERVNVLYKHNNGKLGLIQPKG